MSYQDRRYRVERGRVIKEWKGDSEGWYRTKEEAWAAFHASQAPKAVPAPSVGPEAVDWDAPWLTVLSRLKEVGFDGKTKADAVAFCEARGIETP